MKVKKLNAAMTKRAMKLPKEQVREAVEEWLSEGNELLGPKTSTQFASSRYAWHYSIAGHLVNHKHWDVLKEQLSKINFKDITIRKEYEDQRYGLLEAAIDVGSVQMFEDLLDMGFDVYETRTTAGGGHTAFESLIRSNKMKLFLECLQKRGDDFSSMVYASYHRKPTHAWFLVFLSQNGIDCALKSTWRPTKDEWDQTSQSGFPRQRENDTAVLANFPGQQGYISVKTMHPTVSLGYTWWLKMLNSDLMDRFVNKEHLSQYKKDFWEYTIKHYKTNPRFSHYITSAEVSQFVGLFLNSDLTKEERRLFTEVCAVKMDTISFKSLLNKKDMADYVENLVTSDHDSLLSVIREHPFLIKDHKKLLPSGCLVNLLSKMATLELSSREARKNSKLYFSNMCYKTFGILNYKPFLDLFKKEPSLKNAFASFLEKTKIPEDDSESWLKNKTLLNFAATNGIYPVGELCNSILLLADKEKNQQVIDELKGWVSELESSMLKNSFTKSSMNKVVRAL